MIQGELQKKGRVLNTIKKMGQKELRKSGKGYSFVRAQSRMALGDKKTSKKNVRGRSIRKDRERRGAATLKRNLWKSKWKGS